MSSNLKKPNTKRASRRELDFEAIGTNWHISIESDLSAADFTKLRQAIIKRIELFDLNYSRFRADSLVTAMAKKSGYYKLPEDAQPLMNFYQQLYVHTDGVITPLIGQLIANAGYDANYSLIPGELPETPAWDDVLEYDFPNLRIKRPALLDFGAAGKGYLIDIVAEIIVQAGAKHFSINAGGDILQNNTLPEASKIALEHPSDSSQAIGIASVSSASICGSSGNRRAWGDYHHIFDPRTKSSPKHLHAVWVVAGSTMLADGLATALFFIKPSQLNKWYDYQYVRIFNDYSLEHSTDFPAEFFSERRK